MADDKDDPGDGLDDAIDPEMLARAEQAIAALSDQFGEAIRNDVAALRDHIDAFRTAPDNAGDLDRIFEIAHDLQGQGGSFGYPLISRIGAALCRYIANHRDSADAAALAVFADAAAAIIAGDISGEGDAVSRATVADLETLAAGSGG